MVNIKIKIFFHIEKNTTCYSIESKLLTTLQHRKTREQTLSTSKKVANNAKNLYQSPSCNVYTTMLRVVAHNTIQKNNE